MRAKNTDLLGRKNRWENVLIVMETSLLSIGKIRKKANNVGLVWFHLEEILECTLCHIFSGKSIFE